MSTHSLMRPARPACLAFVTSVVVAAGAWTSAPASAATTLNCVSSDIVHFSPGVTFSMGHVEFDIHAPESAIKCDGAIRGHKITGLGTYAAHGTIDGNCMGGVGKIAKWAMTFPTEGGVQKVDAPGGFTYTGPSGAFRTSAYNGAFQFMPIVGNCVAGGVTSSVVLLEGTLTVE